MKLMFWKKNKEELEKKIKTNKFIQKFKHLFSVVILVLFIVFIIYDKLPSKKATTEDRKLTIREVENYNSNSKDLLVLKVNQKAKKLEIENLNKKFTKGLVLDYSTIVLDQSTQFALANSQKKLTLQSETVLIKIHSKSEKQYYIYQKKIVLENLQKKDK